MRLLVLPFTSRYVTLTIAVLGTAALTAVVYGDPNIGRYLHVLPAVFAFLVLPRPFSTFRP
jgi:hypothetical protein